MKRFCSTNYTYAGQDLAAATTITRRFSLQAPITPTLSKLKCEPLVRANLACAPVSEFLWAAMGCERERGFRPATVYGGITHPVPTDVACSFPHHALPQMVHGTSIAYSSARGRCSLRSARRRSI